MRDTQGRRESAYVKHLSIRPSIRLPIYLPTHPPTYPSIVYCFRTPNCIRPRNTCNAKSIARLTTVRASAGLWPNNGNARTLKRFSWRLIRGQCAITTRQLATMVQQRGGEYKRGRTQGEEEEVASSRVAGARREHAITFARVYARLEH